MRIGQNLGLAAMLEAENEVALSEAEAAETVNELNESSDELIESSDGIAADSDLAADAITGTEELEGVADIAVAANADGEGLSEDAAKVVTITVESICNRLRLDTPRILSAESFGNPQSRRHSTELTIESIGGTLKQIWTAIKNIALRIKDRFVQFFANLFKSATILNKHLVSLKRRADAMDSSFVKKEKVLKSSSLARAFSVKKKASLATMNEIVGNVDKLQGVTKGIVPIYSNWDAQKLIAANFSTDAIKAYLESSTNAAEQVARLVASAGTKLDASDVAGTAMKKDKNRKDVEAMAYGPFVNNLALVAETSKRTVDGVDVVSIDLSFASSKDAAATEIEALTLAEIKTVISDAVKRSDAIVEFKKTQGDIAKVTDQIVKATDTLLGTAMKALEANGASAETKRGLSELRRDVNEQFGMLNKFANRAPALAFDTVSKMGDYVSASLKNLGQPK